jgi:hypothetical protein
MENWMNAGKAAPLAFLIILTLALGACMPSRQAQTEPNTLDEPAPGKALQADAAEYARQTGVSQEEALRRLNLQDEFGGLNALLQSKESQTFSGSWIQHEPDYRLVVAFTQDGEQTIQPYLEGKSWADLVEIMTFSHSLAELKTAQQQAMKIANTLNIPITSGIVVRENRVNVVVGNPELFLEEVHAAGLELPEPVEVVAIDPDNLTDTLRGEVETYQGPQGQTIYFPKQPPSNSYMTALLEGTLILDENGCLSVKDQTGDAHLILWRSDFELQVGSEGIEVLNDEGQVAARVGEEVRAGGGEGSASAIPGMPLDACPGPYWSLGDIDPLNANP